MEGTDQLQAFEKHLHSTVVNSGGVIIQLIPGQLGIKTTTVGGDLILCELARLPQPSVRIAVEPAPVQKRIEVNGAATQLDAVLLQPSLLNVLRLCRGHIAKADGSGYRPKAV